MIKDIKRVDELLEHKKGLKNSVIKDRNDDKIEGDTIKPTKNIVEKLQNK